MKKTICIITIIILTILLWFYSYSKFKSDFLSISNGTPESIVIKKIGKPAFIRQTYSEIGAQDWVYVKYFRPTHYVLVIKDGVVVHSYVSISP